MRYKLYSILLGFIGVGGCLSVAAQSDTLAGVRRFLKVCNDYKTLPVQVEVEISKSTNMVLSRADTAAVKAIFYLDKNGSYIAMEGVEQLANDSLVLLVNKTTKRMMVAANHQSVADRLRETLSLKGQDSSVSQLAGKFLATEGSAEDTSIIDLTSRLPVPHASFPREQITVRYSKRTGDLIEVLAVNRSLLSVGDSVFKVASERPEWAGRTVSFIAGHDSSYFLIREQQTVFRYLKIAHAQAAPLPAQISDRLVSIGPGEYRPAKSYTDFVLSKQY